MEKDQSPNEEYLHQLKEYLKNPPEVIEFKKLLIRLYQKTKDKKIRKTIIQLLEYLKEVSTESSTEKILLNEAKEKIEKEKESMITYKKYFSYLYKRIEEFLKRTEETNRILQEKTFDETKGFFWKTKEKENNVILLKEIKKELEGYKKQAHLSQIKEGLNYLLHFIEKIKEENKNSFVNFYRALMNIEKITNEFLQEINTILKLRSEGKEHIHELNNPQIAKELNNEKRRLCEVMQAVLSQKQILNEIAFLKKTLDQFIQSLDDDLDEIKEILSPSAISFASRKKRGIEEKYYIEAPTSKTFFTPKYTTDVTGVYDSKESHDTLFKEQPVFDNHTIYGLQSPINHLVEQYFNTKKSIMPEFEKYKNELLTLVKKSPLLPRSIKGLVVIPINHEEKKIFHVLEQYAQAKRNNEIAFIIFENKTINEKRDYTYLKIQQFRMKYPHIVLYHVYKNFQKKMPIGYIRKYATEYALLLHYFSKKKGVPLIENPIIISGDGDSLKVHQDYFQAILQAFEKEQTLDVIEMKMDFPQEYFFVYPTFWVIHRLFDFSWKYMRYKVNPNKSIRTYGPAMAIKASSYYLIKGFNPKTRLCEDLQISWLLDEGRRSAKKDKNYFAYLPQEIITSPRRSIHAYLSQISILDMYNNRLLKDIPDEEWEDILAKETKKGLLNVGNIYSPNIIREAINKRLKEYAQHPINLTLAYNLQRYVDWWQYKINHSKWLSIEEFKDMLQRVLSWIGIEYQLTFKGEQWEITILSCEKLIKNLQKKIAQSPLEIQLQVINYTPLQEKKENIYSNLNKKVKKILEETYPEPPHISHCIKLSEGILSENYSLILTPKNSHEEKIIIKIATRESILKEGFILREILSHRIGYPTYYKEGTLHENLKKYYYLITFAIEGEPLTRKISHSSPQALLIIASQLGKLVRELHEIKGEYFGEFKDKLKGKERNWYEYLIHQLEKYRERGKRNKKLPAEEIEHYIFFLKENRHLIENAESCLLHNDIWEENILIKENNVFLIDFENAILGDNYYELAQIEMMMERWPGDTAQIEKYKEAFYRSYYKKIRKQEEIEEIKIRVYKFYRIFLNMIRGKRRIPEETIRKLYQEIIQYQPYRKTKERKHTETIYFLGHNKGNHGEVTTLKKYEGIAKTFNIPFKTIDIYGLLSQPFEGTINGKRRLHQLVENQNNHISKRKEILPFLVREKVEHLFIEIEQKEGIAWFVTNPYNQQGLLALDINVRLPTIGWFYPYSIYQEKENIISYLNKVDLIVTYSPIGVKHLLFNGIRKEKIILIPLTYSTFSLQVFNKIEKPEYLQEKEKYLHSIAKKMKKEIKLNADTIIFTVFSRLIPKYNIQFILNTFKEIAQENHNIILLLKSPLKKNDDASLTRLLNSLQKEPWFLWDQEFEEYQTFYEKYGYGDYSIFMFGAGQGGVENLSMGTPLILLDIPYNRSLYEDMAYWVKAKSFDGKNQTAEPNKDSFKEVIHELIKKGKTTWETRKQIRNIAEKRFSPTIVWKRMMIAKEAARIYHNKEPKAYERMKKEIENILEEDLKRYT